MVDDMCRIRGEPKLNPFVSDQTALPPVPSRTVILTNVRIQSHERRRGLPWIPDQLQHDETA